MLSCLCQNAWPQQRDALQEYLDQIALRQTEQVASKGVQDGESVTVPTGLTEVDLSQFSAAQNRTGALEIKASVKFVNGTISASGNYAGSDCLLKVSAGATVVLDATASVDASATALPLAAVGIYGGSTFYQCGDITAPNKGTGVAIYLSGTTDTYNYVSGKTTGTISNPNGGTVNGLDATPEAYAVQSTDGTMLSFYYDGKKASREGQVFTNLKAQYDSSKKTYYMPWERSTITTVVFDKTFANYDGLTDMSYWFKGCSSLTTISGLEYVNTSKVADMVGMFYGCSSLTTLDVSNFDTSKVTNMESMFRGCRSLTTLDVSNFNTSNVMDMEYMFYGCSGLTTLDVSNFNTSNVTNMANMFSGCSGLTSLDVSNFSTSNVTDMGWMFSGCSGLTALNLSSFNTSSVTGMGYMFYGCSGLTTLDISSFNTSNVTDMWGMFSGCSGLASLDLSNFNTSSVANMGDMFYGCKSLTTLDVSSFNTSKVANMVGMFYGCSGLASLDLSNFNTSSIANMWGMFSGCSGLTSLNLSNFNTSNVTNMSGMFSGCSGLTSLDVSSFNTSKVTNMGFMFNSCSGLKTIKVGDAWTTDNVTSSGNMFANCTSLVGGDGTVFDSNYTDKTKAYAGIGGYLTKDGQEAAPEAYAVLSTDGTTLSFYYDGKKSSREGQVFTSLNYDSSMYAMPWCSSTITTVVFDESFANYDGLTNMSCYFYNCSGLATISGLEYVNTSNVTDMFEMFSGCSVLTNLDLRGFTTSNVTNMYGMFRNCSGLKTLDLSSFNTSKVTDMLSMFYGCSGLTNLNLSGFNTSSVTNMAGMFSGCSGLTSLDLSNFNTSKVTNMESMFSGCSGLTSLNLSSFNTSSVTDMGNMFYGCSGLTNLDLSSFNTSNVTNMLRMFNRCYGMVTIKVGDGWTTDNVVYSNEMFAHSTNIVGGDGTVFNSNYTDKTKAYAGIGGYLTKDGQETSRYTKEELESALNSLLALLNSMDKNCQDAKTRYQNVMTYIDTEMQEAIYKDFNWYDAASANYHMEILVLKEDLSSSTVSGYDKIGDAIEITRKNITAIQTEARSKLEGWQEAVKAAAAADLQAKLDALGAKLTKQQEIISKQRSQCEDYSQWKDYYFCKRLDSQTLAELEKLYNQVLSAEKDNYDKINSYNTLVKSSSISSVEDIGGIYKEYEALAAKVDAIAAEVETCSLALSAIETTYNSIPVNFPDESLAFTIAPQGISKDIQMGYKSNRGFVLTSSGKMRFEQVDGANFLLRDMNGNYIVATKNSPDLTAGTKEEATVWTGRCNGFSNGKGLYTFYSDAASRYLTCVYGDVNAEITASGTADYGYWTIEESTLDDLQAFMNLLEEEQSSGSSVAETDTLTIVLPQFDEDTTPSKPFVFPVRPGPTHIIMPWPGPRFWPIPNPVPGQRRPKDFHPIEIPKGSHVILDDITFRDLIGGDHVIYVEGIVEINVTVKVFIENWEWFVHVGPGGKVIWRTDPDGNGKRPRLMNDEGGTIDMEGGYIGYIDNSGTMNHRLGTIDHVINRKTYYFTGGIVCYVDNRGHWLHSKGTAYRVRNAADCTYEMTGGEINNMTGSVTDTVFVNYGRFLFRDGWMRGYGSRFIYHYRKAYLYIDGGRFDFTHIRNYFIEAHEDFYIRGDYDYAPPVPYLLRPSVTIRVLYRWLYKFNIVFIDGRPTPRYPLFRGEDFDLSRDHYRYIDWDLPSKRWRWYYNPGDNTIEPRDEEVYDEDDLQAYLNWLAENRDGEAASTEDKPQTLSLSGREIVITQPVELPVGTHVLIVDGRFMPREAWTHDRMFYVPKTSTIKFVNVVFDFSSKTHYIVDGVLMPRYIFHIYGDVRFGADCRILGYYDNTRVATDDYIPGAMIAAAPGGRLWIDGAHFDGVTFLISEEVNIYVMSRLINHIYVYVPTAYRHKGFRFMAPWQDYRIDLTDLEFVKLVNADDWTADIDEDGNVFLKNVNETGIRTISGDADEQYPAYDLQGRKFINSSRGQMFIRNGKKFIAK